MEENKELETNEELNNYEVQVQEYELKLEEAMINIETKENIALANPEDEQALLDYKKAKADYEALRKEYHIFKKENKEQTWWTTLPLRMKIFSLCTLVFAFPGLSWVLLPLWYYPYLWFYEIFSDGLKRLYGTALKAFVYIYLGIMWYLVVGLLIAGLVMMFVKKKKSDVTDLNRKAYFGFIIANMVCIIGLLAYQIYAMITIWF